MSGQTLARDLAPPVGARPTARLSRKRLALAALGLAALTGAGLYADHYWRVGRFIETTDDAYVGGNVTPIAPHIAGFVAEVSVADNQRVAAGQLLVRLDPADEEAALTHARAVLESRQAALAALQARRVMQQSLIAGAAADLTAKQAEAAFAAEDEQRYRVLAATAAGSRQNAEKALAGERAAAAAVAASQAALRAAAQQLAVLDTEIAAAKADAAEAEADLRTAHLNLGYTAITAPVAGWIGNRSAQVGAYVSAGTNLLSLVPAQGLWVDANFKEDEIARMKPGDPATIVADVLPGRVFHGHVDSLSPATGAVFSVIPPQNATGNFTKIVQRVPVRIALEGDAAELGALRPGLSAYVSVDTRRAGQ
ncbi:MAG TPA: HlyD family secretion protein [Acetobacteraceae bacterium]|nr:HlyD family secretion protein [Acetobacteraceae bacterium]